MTYLNSMDINEKNTSSRSDDFENPSLFKSSVESILFQEDEGPVSSFLNGTPDVNVMTPVSASQQHPTIGSAGTISPLEVYDTANGPARNVRFIDLDSFEEEKRSVSEQEPTNEVSVILRERIVQVQSELVTEKALRKKKEKNLIKLAKELNKRTSDAQEKDTKILEMTSKVQELEEKLQSNHKESAMDMLSYRVTCRENEGRIAEFDTTVTALRKQLFEANLEAEVLKSKLDVYSLNSTRMIPDEVKKPAIQIPAAPSSSSVVVTAQSSPKSNMFSSVTTMIVVGAIGVLVAFSFGIVSMDTVCAPALPWGSLSSSTTSSTMEAPWWAPDSTKEPLFNAICGTRLRTRISWNGDKMIISKMIGGSKPSIAWQGRAPLGVKVEASKLRIITKTGENIIDAPWALKALK